MTHICILLATHNGAAFLKEQLQSFLDQTHQDWSLWVSDDASTDATRTILREFQTANRDREIKVFEGPNQGLFANFMSLLRHPDLPDCYVAFSDQDDVWLPHRLSNGLQALARFTASAFYCSTRITTDAALNHMSGPPCRPLPEASFPNALVQNLAAGNTMLLNPNAVHLLRNDPRPPMSLPYHDWWIYLRLMAAGADLICDPRPGLLYRQHANNFLGHRKSRRLNRLRVLMNGTYRSWVKTQAEAVLQLPLDTVLAANRRSAEILLSHPMRLAALRKSRARRHDPLGRVLLPLLASLQRL